MKNIDFTNSKNEEKPKNGNMCCQNLAITVTFV